MTALLNCELGPEDLHAASWTTYLFSSMEHKLAFKTRVQVVDGSQQQSTRVWSTSDVACPRKAAYRTRHSTEG